MTTPSTSNIIPTQSNASTSKLKSRRARFAKVLTYYDKPQLVLLRSQVQIFLAISVPSETNDKYFATTVQPGNWELYLADKLSLRYLFVYPNKRMLFYFNAQKIDGDGFVKMDRFEDEIDPAHLPGPKLFASDHTEQLDEMESISADVETLFLDGQWDLPEMGKFQRNISDVYNFVFSIDDWSETRDLQKKQKIQKTITSRPFRGGSSYGAYFSDLERRLDSTEKVKLKSIQKASPGELKVTGVSEVFSEVENLITTYLTNKNAATETHLQVKRYLAKHDLAKLNVSRFDVSDPRSKSLEMYADTLSEHIGFSELSSLRTMTNQNELGVLKIVLAIFRRVASAGEFFAQGRAGFER